MSALTLQAAVVNAAGGGRPRLVVQIVVSQMRYDYLERFKGNFSEGGFRRFMDNGTVFTDCRYDYMLTGTEASLATITTGAMPSTHGVTGGSWVDFLTGRQIQLADDREVCGVGCSDGVGCHSPQNLTVPTLGDRLLEESPRSRVVTVAASAASAVVMGGFTKEVFWCDTTRGTWISSTRYMQRIPLWVESYNEERPAHRYVDEHWKLSKHREQYLSNNYSVIEFEDDGRAKRSGSVADRYFGRKGQFSRDFARIYTTPAGNTLVKEFARRAIVDAALGRDEYPDLLNVCFDSPRLAGRIFGPESMETEDMFYRLDSDIEDLVNFIYTQLPPEQVVIVLTSDHGTSDSYDRLDGAPGDRFNVAQLRVIINGFMNAQYGSGDWVLGYCDRQLYLNRDLIYRNGLSLREVQDRVAAYVLQFRGVSHALTATALSSSSFASGYGRLMQNSFYPRRSGDVVINLMPGWIEEQEGVRSMSGSMYDYDTHVPLMVLGGGLTATRIRAPADPSQIAPTLARLMRIDRPVAATGDEITAITDQFQD